MGQCLFKERARVKQRNVLRSRWRGCQGFRHEELRVLV
jgi:hypothetical protein